MDALAGQAAIAIESNYLYCDLQKSRDDLIGAYEETIECWARALDLRDRETEGHSRRVTELALKMAEKLLISPEELAQIRRSAFLHDIGKLGIPDGILLKPGPLTDEEWVVMKKHPEYGRSILEPIAFLRPALDIPYCHHEKWDGSGYPQGLFGEQIPLSARAFALADVYDALTSDRPYRKGWPAEKVREHILAQSAHHFDPTLIPIFLELVK
jgi:HD-GYP domain-containing protein (c-di-GMP phosphodiesterase class II)